MSEAGPSVPDVNWLAAQVDEFGRDIVRPVL